VAANADLPDPAGVDVVRVGTAEELRQAMHRAATAADAVVMAAAVADFRPAEVSASKIKKTGDPADAPPLRLVRTADVLAELVAKRAPGQVVVGFAAETGDTSADVLTHARAKLARKGCDLLVVNDVSGGAVFGHARNAVTILDARGGAREVPEDSKEAVADAVWDAVAALLPSLGTAEPGTAAPR
jgi:phosphopantothenoylcysteine decarboxylase/phosphopantothenate--cysteine ligase